MGTDRRSWDFGVPQTRWPSSSTTDSLISMRRRATSTLETFRAASSPHRNPQYARTSTMSRYCSCAARSPCGIRSPCCRVPAAAASASTWACVRYSRALPRPAGGSHLNTGSGPGDRPSPRGPASGTAPRRSFGRLPAWSRPCRTMRSRPAPPRAKRQQSGRCPGSDSPRRLYMPSRSTGIRLGPFRVRPPRLVVELGTECC